MSKKKLRLIVNPAPVITQEGFRARLDRCRAELSPMLDQLSRRHCCEAVLAALLVEIEEGTVALHSGGRLSRKAVEGVIARLRRIDGG